MCTNRLSIAFQTQLSIVSGGSMLNRQSLWTRAALFALSLTLPFASPAMSQSFYGALVAVVQDAQGGVIPGATVVLTNTATTERRESVSSEDGTARFVN